MRIFGIAGWSGSGKTTLLKRLIPALRRDGLTVSTIKHAHHDFDLDTPGKDSWEHREAGALEVMIASDRRWALQHESGGADLDLLVSRMSEVDLLLIEGFKRHPHPRVELLRPSLGKPPLHRQDPWIRALILVEPSSSPDRGELPRFPVADIGPIARFVVEHATQVGRRA